MFVCSAVQDLDGHFVLDVKELDDTDSLDFLGKN